MVFPTSPWVCAMPIRHQVGLPKIGDERDRQLMVTARAGLETWVQKKFKNDLRLREKVMPPEALADGWGWADGWLMVEADGWLRCAHEGVGGLLGLMVGEWWWLSRLVKLSCFF